MQRGDHKLISEVNSRRKWILMKAYMCTDARYKCSGLSTGFVREAFVLLDVGSKLMQLIIRWKCKPCHVKNLFRTTLPCWKTKVPCQHIYHLWWSIAVFMELFFLLQRVESVCMAGTYSHTMLYKHTVEKTIHMIFYFPAN